jgi:hypothetical protein
MRENESLILSVAERCSLMFKAEIKKIKGNVRLYVFF